MSFAIVSSLHAIISFIYYCIAFGYYIDRSASHDNIAVAFFFILLVLSLVEFITAIAVASYCCEIGCSCCCYKNEIQVVRFFIFSTI